MDWKRHVRNFKPRKKNEWNFEKNVIQTQNKNIKKGESLKRVYLEIVFVLFWEKQSCLRINKCLLLTVHKKCLECTFLSSSHIESEKQK